MGLMDNFKGNTGGLGGGLMAAGDMFAAMAAGVADIRPGESVGTALGRGMAMGQGALREGFARGRDQMQDNAFRAWAGEAAESAPPGSRAAQLFSTAAAGPAGDRMARLLPSLWRAQSLDARSRRVGAPTAAQQADNAEIDQARRRLEEIRPEGADFRDLIGREFEADQLNRIIGKAMQKKVGVADPEHARFYDLATTGPLAGIFNQKPAPGDEPGGISSDEDGAGFWDSVVSSASSLLGGTKESDGSPGGVSLETELANLLGAGGANFNEPPAPTTAPLVPGLMSTGATPEQAGASLMSVDAAPMSSLPSDTPAPLSRSMGRSDSRTRTRSLDRREAELRRIQHQRTMESAERSAERIGETLAPVGSFLVDPEYRMNAVRGLFSP